MRTTLHHQDGPLSATVSDHEDFCVLGFRQGDNQMFIHLPRHMSGPAHLMVDAFNSNMNPPKPVMVQAGDPVDVFDATARDILGDRYDPDPVEIANAKEYVNQPVDITSGKVVGFPTGGAMSAEAVLAVVAANYGDAQFNPAQPVRHDDGLARFDIIKGREGDGDHAIITGRDLP